MEAEAQKVIREKCKASVPVPESVVLGAVGATAGNYSQRITCPVVQVEPEPEGDECEDTLVVATQSEMANPQVSEFDTQSSSASQVSNVVNQGSPSCCGSTSSRSRPRQPSSCSPSLMRSCEITSFSSSPDTNGRLSLSEVISESNQSSPSIDTTPTSAVSSTQKRKRSKQNERQLRAKRINISNTRQSSNSLLEEDEGEVEEEEEEEDDSKRLPHFTIHLLLPAAELDHRFNFEPSTSCGDDIEFELIQNVMEQINGVANGNGEGTEKTRTKRRNYKHHENAADFPDNSDSNFATAFYSRLTNSTASFGAIAHGVFEETGFSDTLSFVYRPGVIFCITTRQGWLDIRRFVDFTFPEKIMCRLTYEASNVETRRFFTGALLRSIEYSRNPSEPDQLTSFSENSIKQARSDSSLYKLDAFKTPKGNTSKKQIGMKFELTGVRIHRKIFPKCIPQLLGHLFTIFQGGDTHVFGSDGKTLEKDIKMRLVRCLSQGDPIATQLNMKLTSTIYKFMTNSCTEELLNRFEVCPSQLSKFFNACNFVLCYEPKTGEKHSQELSGCQPTSQEVFEAMTRIGPVRSAKDLGSFQQGIKELKLKFSVNGKMEEPISFLNLLAGEVSLEGRTYWKFATMWLYFTGEYHHLLDKKFLEILNMKTQDGRQDGILFESAEDAKLINPWNAGEKKSDYLEKYRNYLDLSDTIYCLPPTDGDTKYLFAMMIVEVKQDHPFLSILYIFDRFSSGLPPASDIINESLNKIINSTDTDHHLQAFYEYQVRKGHGSSGNLFPTLFPKFKDFQRCFQSDTERKVSVVVGFLTGSSAGEDENGAKGYTLQREKTLPRKFGREDGHKILELLQKYPEELERIQRNLGKAQSKDPEGIADDMSGFILKLLLDCGYSLNEDGDLSGSLLKIQFSSDFKMFRNDELNEKVFDECIREKFITGFPGFKHKLEVYFIRNKVAHENQFQLRLVDL